MIGKDDGAVTAVTAACYRIPTSSPESDGTLSWDSTTMITVTASAQGQAGTGWTYGSAAVRSVVADTLAPLVVGHAVMDVAGAAQAMNRAVRNMGREGIASMAISAVDCALWDLKARLLGLPLVTLLGQALDEVPVYGSGGFITYGDAETKQQLTDWVERDRIPRVKIKIGESWGANEARDIQRVALAREIIGPATELYVDANGGYRTGQARRVAGRLSEYGVTWFEEPVSSQDLTGLALLRRTVSQDVAAGEYSWTLADSARLIDAGAVDCLQLDATRCGGITGFRQGAALAAAHNLPVSAHCAPNAHAHVAAATPNLRHVEYFHDHQRIEQMLFDGALDPADGAMRPDLSEPGLGLEFRADMAEQYRQS
jgi:L-alanine-DL-glutamate epimerase-like enolase superfamily enzyme